MRSALTDFFLEIINHPPCTSDQELINHDFDRVICFSYAVICIQGCHHKYGRRRYRVLEGSELVSMCPPITYEIDSLHIHLGSCFL